MKYKIQNLKIDLGTTPIENIFINNFLGIADGNAVKFYIYAYKLAYEHNSNMPELEAIGEELGMTPIELNDAIDFWMDQGILTMGEDGESLVFLSLRELFLGITETDIPENVIPEDDITNKEMFDIIEQALETQLTPNEITKILKHREEFGQKSDLIAHAFSHVHSKTGKRNVNYVVSVLRNWAIDGVMTIQDQEAYSEKTKTKTHKKSVKKMDSNKSQNVRASGGISSDELKDILDRKLREDIERAMGDSVEDS